MSFCNFHVNEAAYKIVLMVHLDNLKLYFEMWVVHDLLT